MDTAYVKEFIVLAQICNYGRAAEALYISQSSLFNHIRALETEIGVPLFDRKGRKIVLSEAGQMFLPYAKTIAAASKEFTELLAEDKTKKNNAIRIVTQYRITNMIKAFRKQYPHFGIHFLDYREPSEVLNDGSCELAFIRNLTPEDQKKYHNVPYVLDCVAAAVSPDHPLAGRKTVTLSQLKGEDFIVIAQREKRDCHCLDICNSAGFVPDVVMTASNGSEAARLVSEGFGISLFLKRTILSEGFDNLVLLDLEPEIRCTVSLCWQKDRPLSPGAEALVQFVKDRSPAYIEEYLQERSKK